MLNYKELMASKIGKRIDRFASNLEQDSEKFLADLYEKEYVDLTKNDFSRIKNASYNGNRKFILSNERIEAFCNYFRVEPAKLIWGTEEEREDFAKMVLLGLMSNGDIDYSTGKELNPFLETEWNKDDFGQEARNPVFDELSDVETFFHNKENYEYYEILIGKPDKDSMRRLFDYGNIFEKSYMQKHSLVLSRDFNTYKGNYEYQDFLSTKFNDLYSKISELLCKRLDMYAKCYHNFHLVQIQIQIDMEIEEHQKSIDEVKNKTYQYFAGLIGYKKCRYYYFTNVIFPGFWQHYKDEYMAFFDEYIFCVNDDFTTNGIRKFKNQHFDSQFLSAKFIELNRNISERFYDDKIELLDKRPRRRANPSQK